MNDITHLRGPLGALVLLLAVEVLYAYGILCPVLRAVLDPEAPLVRLAVGPPPDELFEALRSGETIGQRSHASVGRIRIAR